MLQTAQAPNDARYDECVLRVVLHCEERLSERISLAELAGVAGFSPHHFHRIFRAVTGEAPAEFLRRLRLERAAYRLKISTDTALQIALESGFTTHETFTRAFTRQFGLTPSEFRAMLSAMRECLGPTMASRTFGGFGEDTPLTLRFDLADLADAGLAVVRPAPRHLLCVRHHGYQHLLAGGRDFLDLWTDLFQYADAQGVAYDRDLLVGITHDDPYVTEEPRIRFDACLPVAGPLEGPLEGLLSPPCPFFYRHHAPGTCVTRRHSGGLEEVARTFAYIGVNWLPPDGYGLRTGAPFELYHCARTPDGGLRRLHTDAIVPLEPTRLPERKKARP